MAIPLRILLVEDNPQDAELVVRELRRAGFEPEWTRVDTEAEYTAHLDATLDLILSDFAMPRFNGLRALELVVRQGLDVPFILVSGTIGEDTAVNAIKSGAADYLLKDRLSRLGPAVTGALRQSRLRKELRSAALYQAHLAAIIESSLDAIIGKTLDGFITSWNGSAERLFGYSSKEAIGQRGLLLIPPERMHEEREILEKLQRGEHVNHFETVRVTKAGMLVDVSVTISPVRDANGTLVGSSKIVRDISERNKLEAQLRQAQIMEAIGQLAGGIAHDFNNLLLVINGYSQLMMARFKTGDRNYHDLELIYKTGERAAALTRQLLAFSRQQVLQPVVLNLNAVTDDMNKLLRRLLREDIELTTILAPSLRRVKADPGQIEQVIVNLVVNARDAMPNGGKIIIETANVELDAEYCRSRGDLSPGCYVMLAVTDNGEGMQAAVKVKIFEPFFTTKPKGQGTGLGLATVFGVVKQSNGHIEVYSEVGSGTSFKLYLPVTLEASSSDAFHKQVNTPVGDELILVVEDEVDVREIVRNFLEMSGYTVLVAANGVAALALCEQHDGLIHLLITDVIMPDMGGPELAAAIRTKYSGIKVLFMSGYTNDAAFHDVKAETPGAFIQKPFTPVNLVRKVREILDNAL